MCKRNVRCGNIKEWQRIKGEHNTWESVGHGSVPWKCDIAGKTTARNASTGFHCTHVHLYLGTADKLRAHGSDDPALCLWEQRMYVGVVSLGVNKVHVGTFVLSLTFSSILSPLFCPVLMSVAVCACVSSRSQTTLCLPALGEKPCTNETPPRRHCVSSGDIVLTQTGLSRRSFLSFFLASFRMFGWARGSGPK